MRIHVSRMRALPACRRRRVRRRSRNRVQHRDCGLRPDVDVGTSTAAVSEPDMAVPSDPSLAGYPRLEVPAGRQEVVALPTPDDDVGMQAAALPEADLQSPVPSDPPIAADPRLDEPDDQPGAITTRPDGDVGTQVAALPTTDPQPPAPPDPVAVAYPRFEVPVDEPAVMSSPMRRSAVAT